MRHRFLVLLPIVLLSACGGSPKTHFHTLVTEPSGQAMHVSVRGDNPIEVGHVTLPGTLDRLWLVTRGEGTSIEISDRDRWVAPLNELIQRALTADLRDRIGVPFVVAPGDPSPPGGVRVLAVNIEQFSGDATGQVVLEADWVIRDPGRRTGEESRHAVIRVDAGSSRPEAITAAMSLAIAKLSDRIAAAA